MPKYAAFIEEVDKMQEKNTVNLFGWFTTGKKLDNFEVYFDGLGIDSEKWVRIFRERLGIVNENAIQYLTPKHFGKVQEFVLEDTPEAEIIKQIFKINKEKQFYDPLG